MRFKVNDEYIDVSIERKKANKFTYIRVTKDLTLKVTTNYLTPTIYIEKLLNENYYQIEKMLAKVKAKKANNTGFYYLGKKYDIVYIDKKDLTIGNNKVFFSRDFSLDTWYKKKAQEIFPVYLAKNYNNFTRKIPKPTLRIRKMTSRWGVCNIKTKVITLNLELIKRDLSYLDYVIIHELSHLVYPDHSKSFWHLVEENMPNYKKYREEMKEF